MIGGRSRWSKKLSLSLKEVNRPLVWFHCASLGEFEQGRPIIEAFKSKYPGYGLLLTFFSPSGFEPRRNFNLADSVQYLPWDTKRNAEKFLDIAQPDLIFFIKYEYWYHMLTKAASRGIPTYLCSALFRPKQIFFRSYGGFFRKILSSFQHIFVQNEPSRKLLSEWAINQVTVAGDTRFDRVRSITENASNDPKVERFVQTTPSPVMIIGSSWPEDMKVLTPLINNHPEMKFIIAPHEIDQGHLQSISESIERKIVNYDSDWDTAEFEVLIIDTIGILSHLYQYADLAYIGGAFGKGLHNILEAATFGIPIFFGNKNYAKFREASDLVNLGGAYPVDSYQTLDQLTWQMQNQPQIRQHAGDICRQYVLENTGATESVMDHLASHLHQL